MKKNISKALLFVLWLNYRIVFTLFPNVTLVRFSNYRNKLNSDVFTTFLSTIITCTALILLWSLIAAIVFVVSMLIVYVVLVFAVTKGIKTREELDN